MGWHARDCELSSSLNPLDKLLPYQRTFFQDKARFSLWLKSRQIGGSFTGAAKIVHKSYKKKNNLWIILSAGERQAMEFMLKCKAWAEIFALGLQYESDGKIIGDPQFNQSEGRLSNGSRIIALPAKPATVRSYSGNILLDEFAHHEDGEAIWSAIFPTISNPLRGEFECIVMSTPCGKHNEFYKLWAENPSFSKHRTTIVDASEQGLKVNVNQLRSQSGMSDNMWAQEFMCEFVEFNESNQVIQTEWVENAMKRPPMPNGTQTQAYCDIAAGGDENVIALRRGNTVAELICWVSAPGANVPAEFIQHFHRLKDKYGLIPEMISADESGMGKIAIPVMGSMGWPVRGINNGAKARDSKYGNLGSEVWANAAGVLQRREIGLPKDDKLFRQLTTRCFIPDKPKWQLQSKKDISESPDRADAIVQVLQPEQVFCVQGYHTGENGFESLFASQGWNVSTETPTSIPGAHAGL